MRWLLLLAGCAACYHPAREASCQVRCGSHGECPGALTCEAASGMCAGAGDVCGDAAPSPSDIGQDCFATHMFGKLCFGTVPGAISPSALDTDATCMLVIQQSRGAPEACVIAADTITVSTAVSVTGSRSLVLLAHQIAIGGAGVLQAIGSSTQLAPGSSNCAGDVGATNASGFAAGGGGGSFQSSGGVGGSNGASALGGNPSPVVDASVLVGGCAGGSGGLGNATPVDGAAGGGPGGGAVYLAADSISISGQVLAYGRGGAGGQTDGGGGGGGSGGMIVLDGFVTIDPSAVLLASGGGGGGGADSTNSASPGGDPTVANPSLGGTAGSAALYGGSGGYGSVSTTAAMDGLPGTSGAGAGGGGGGGAGWIVAPADLVNDGTVYPKPVPFP